MSSIDERIVEMKFKNSQFEQGIRKTMSSLEGLKNGLNLSSSAKGIQDLEKAGRNFSLEPMANAVQTVASKFSALSVVAITAIANITNKALEMGKQFVSQFTVDPIKAGLEEYETNLNSIQTILANTKAAGATLGDVNATLQELNTYSDQTIYNFAEMARNIGTFTAAGVDLKTSAASIKGIANLAALSGSNSQQAATAMYQLSQAIASGKVSLMDWNSVVNAGMGGTVFQRALAETAVAMGKLDSSAVTLSGDMKTVTIAGESFRDSISATNGESWLSSEVLTSTLSQFTGDLTDAELAAQGFTEAQIAAIQSTAQTAKNAATEVKTLSGLMDTLKESAGSGWSQTWQLIIGDFEEAKAMWTGVNNVLSGMIGASADARNAMLTDWKELGGRTVLIDGIKNAFEALMRIVEPIKSAFRQIFPPTTGQQLYDMTVAFKNFTEGLKINGELAGQIERIFRGLFAALDIGRMIIMGVFDVLGNVFTAFSKGDSAVVDFAANFGDLIVNFRDALKNGEKLDKFFNKISFTLVGLVTGIKNLGGFIKDLFQGKFKGPDGVGAAMDNLRERFAPLKGIVEGAGKAWEGFLKVMRKVADFMEPLIKSVQAGIGKLGDAVSEAIETGDYSGIFDALNTGLFAALTIGINKFLKGGINIDMGGGLVDSIKDVFGALNDTLGALQANIKADTLLKIAGAVGVLTVSVVALSLIDSAALTKSLTAITVMFGQLMAGLAVLDKISGDMSAVKMGILAGALILLAGAMVILSIAVKNLSSLDWEGLAKGLAGVIAMLGAMSGTAKLLKGNTAGLTGAGIAMIAMSTGLVIMAAAVKDFADMEWEDLGKGLAGAAGGMIILAGASKILSTNSGGTLLASIGMIAMAAAMKILASALGDFADFQWDEIGRGLVAMAGAVVILTAALMVIPPTALVGAAGLVIASYSLIQFAEGMQEFAKMSWGEIGKAVTLLFAVLLLVAAALLVIPPTGLLGAASLIIVGESMVTFAEAMQKFGEMSWGEIGKAVTILFASLLLLAAGLTLMIAALPGAAALWVAIEALRGLPPVVEALAALAWEDVKKGLEIVALALGTLAVAGLLILPALPGLIGLGIAIGIIGAGAMLAGVGVLAFSMGIASLAVSGAAGAAALKTMADTIIGLIPTAMEALGRGIVLMAGVISNAGPEMTAAMTTLMLAILEAINKTSPQIITTLFNLVLALVNKIAENYPKFVDAGLRMVTSILNGIAKNMGPIVTAGTNVIVEFLKGIQQNLPRITDEGADTVIAFVRSVASTVRTRSGEMRAAGLELAFAIADGMTGGLASKAKSLASKAADMANQALAGAKRALGIASPSKEFHKVGVWSGEGLAGGIDDSAKMAVKSSENMAEGALKALKTNLGNLAGKVFDNDVSRPVIRPVLDLTDVQNESRRLSSMVGAPVISVGTTLDRLGSILGSGLLGADKDEATVQAVGTSTTVFNQYNNSPKALSPEETYRQTRNLLSKTKGGLRNADNG